MGWQNGNAPYSNLRLAQNLSEDTSYPEGVCSSRQKQTPPPWLRPSKFFWIYHSSLHLTPCRLATDSTVKYILPSTKWLQWNLSSLFLSSAESWTMFEIQQGAWSQESVKWIYTWCHPPFLQVTVIAGQHLWCVTSVDWYIVPYDVETGLWLNLSLLQNDRKVHHMK
jgi:hypothetical protein